MIASLRGALLESGPEGVVIEAGGVGYAVTTTVAAQRSLPPLGATAFLLIHTHATQDGPLQLFGFADAAERTLFQLLHSVSGIGPRLALNILSGTPTPELVDALDRGDVARLMAIPGVGKKTAERLIVELRDKVGRMRAVRPLEEPRGPTAAESEAVSALVNLGYRRADAERAVKGAAAAGAADLEDLIRHALRKVVR